MPATGDPNHGRTGRFVLYRANHSGGSSVVKAKRVVESKVTLEQRTKLERRGKPDRRQADVAVAVERRSGERRAKVARRRQIDPTTCERDYTEQEVEFMHALDRYKRTSGRMFPTCSEVLEVLRSLGYEKRTPAAVSGDATAPIVAPEQIPAWQATV